MQLRLINIGPQLSAFSTGNDRQKHFQTNMKAQMVEIKSRTKSIGSASFSIIFDMQILEFRFSFSKSQYMYNKHEIGVASTPLATKIPIEIGNNTCKSVCVHCKWFVCSHSRRVHANMNWVVPRICSLPPITIVYWTMNFAIGHEHQIPNWTVAAPRRQDN